MDTVTKLILKRKFARRSPWALAFAIWLVAILGGILVGATVASILCWVLLININKEIGLDRTSRYVQIVAVGIAVLAYSGMLILPWNVCILVSSGVMAAVVPGFQLNFLDYTLTATVITIVALPVFVFVGKLICRHTNYTIPEELVKGNIKMDVTQIVALICVIFVFCSLFAPNFFSDTSLIAQFSNTIGVAGTLILAAIIMEIVVIGKESICEIDHSFRNYVNWVTILLVMAALVIANFLTTEDSGINAFLQGLLQPVFGGKTLLIFLVLLCIICTISTNCLNNAVLMTLLIPIAALFAPEYGVSNQYLVTIMAILLTMGLMLPSGSINGSLLHAQSQLITSPQAMKWSFVLTTVYSIITIIISMVNCSLGII